MKSKMAPKGAMAMASHKRNQAEHNANDAFVKSGQDKLKKLWGRPAKLDNNGRHLNAEMVNTGRHAADFANDLTKGLDKTAFPVKKF